MSSPECYRIFQKALQYMLSIHNRRVYPLVDENPEIGLLFVMDKEEDSCEEVKVFYEGHCEKSLDIRYLLKIMDKEIDVIKKLQSNVNGPCLFASHIFNNERKLYSFQHCSKLGWKLETINENITHGNIKQYSMHTISIYVNLSINVVNHLHNSTFSFLKRCQLLMPYLTIVSKVKEQSYKRSGIQNYKEENKWFSNVCIYLRTFSETHFTHVKYKNINMEQNESYLGPSFSIIYGSSGRADIGKEHHLHIFVFSKNGVPLSVDSTQWHKSVSLLSITSSEFELQIGRCTPSVSDVCYYLVSAKSSASYFFLMLLEDESHLQFILEGHGGFLASLLKEAVHSTNLVVEAYEKENKWCEIIASSVGSIIRSSLDDKFRKECLHLIEATDSLEATVKFKSKIIHQIRK